jgi:hypothetical protein
MHAIDPIRGIGRLRERLEAMRAAARDVKRALGIPIEIE